MKRFLYNGKFLIVYILLLDKFFIFLMCLVVLNLVIYLKCCFVFFLDKGKDKMKLSKLDYFFFI